MATPPMTVALQNGYDLEIIKPCYRYTILTLENQVLTHMHHNTIGHGKLQEDH